MANSFKDALISAGVVSKDTLEREKENARREKIQNKGPSQEGIHAHHIRTDCAHCGKNASDVEYYEHHNRSVEAKWLCMICADKAWIKDECRQTNQSSQSKAGKFRREFGATKRFAVATPATPIPPVARPQQSSPSGNKNLPNSTTTAQTPSTGGTPRVEYPARQFPKRRN